jgi:hypothetical protein
MWPVPSQIMKPNRVNMVVDDIRSVSTLPSCKFTVDAEAIFDEAIMTLVYLPLIFGRAKASDRPSYCTFNAGEVPTTSIDEDEDEDETSSSTRHQMIRKTMHQHRRRVITTTTITHPRHYTNL